MLRPSSFSPQLCRLSANRTPSHNPGCIIEAKVVQLAEMTFYLAQDLVFDISTGLPSAIFNPQVPAAEGQPPLICFLILA
jgi:hypothetical protein